MRDQVVHVLAVRRGPFGGWLPMLAFESEVVAKSVKDRCTAALHESAMRRGVSQSAEFRVHPVVLCASSADADDVAEVMRALSLGQPIDIGGD